MKLQDSNISVEQHGTKKEEHFSIGDLGMVLEILRSKLYADPIGAICREITCNARDAHREVGKGDVPIKVVLPTDFDSNYRVIDYGPGISPDRMSNVFIQFASSTKRTTNEQTGGFGLGAKTPFAYGDSFTIVTVTDGIKRTYAAFIDPTKVGKLSLLHTVSTDEPNSTEIVIPVKSRDFQRFREKTEIACQYWDVPPTVVGDYRPRTLNPEDAILDGKDWKIFRSGQYDREHLIIIDGIAYKLDNDIIDKNQNNSDAPLHLLFAGSKKILLYFPNGQLSLSANRESIHWDEKTKSLVEQTCVALVKELRSKFQVQIEAAASYIEACQVARDLTKAFSITNGTKGFFSWKDHKVIATIDRTVLGQGGVQWSRHKTMTSSRPIPDNYKVLRDKVGSWDFSLTDMIVINDINIQNLSPKRCIQILNSLGPDYESLTMVSDKFLEAKELADIVQFIPYVKLSAYGKPGKVAKERKAMRMVFRRIGTQLFGRSSAKEFEDDKSMKLYVMLSRGYSDKLQAVMTGQSPHSVDQALDYLEKKYNVRIYGFENSVFQDDPESFEDFTEEAMSVEDFIEETLKSIDLPRLKAASVAFNNTYNSAQNRQQFVGICKEVEPYVLNVQAKEDLQKLPALYRAVNELKSEWEGVRVIVEVIKAKQLLDFQVTDKCPEAVEFNDLYRGLKKRFPMLSELTSALGYSINSNSRLMETVANYVDLRTKFETNESI